MEERIAAKKVDADKAKEMRARSQGPRRLA